MRFPLLAAALMALAHPAAAQTARFDWFEYEGSDPVDTAVRPGPGEYRNPVLQGFYPDPSVTRVGRDFYLVNSTFSWFPGIPVFHSRDLVHWTQIGNAIDRPDQLDFKQLGMSRGVFAPTIQAKDGVFYILNTCVNCGDNFVITARNPAGPWSNPVWLHGLDGGIDPSLFFDDDGTAWLVNNGLPEGPPQYDGHRAIWLQQFDVKTLKPFGPRKLILNGGADFARHPVWIEGPHILKKDGWYYLVCAEGGTEVRHSEVALRSRSVWGPYEPDPANPILTQRDLPADRPSPITSAGHAQLVDAGKAGWWATFLATRPYAGDFYNTGRETFLMPVRWEDGWPRITDPGQAIPNIHTAPAMPRQPAGPIPTNGGFFDRADFRGPGLPLDWMMMRNPRTRWYSFDKGVLVLQARPEGLADNTNPSFLARRQQHANAQSTTMLHFQPQHEGDRAGLVVLQNDDYWAFIGIGMQGGKIETLVETKAGGPQRIVFESRPLADSRPRCFRIKAEGGKYLLEVGNNPERMIVVAELDGTAFSTRTAGGFVGAMMGVYAHSGAGAAK
jgi:alpha-N-arabinofuranosidase